jgi:DNA-binding MarR family transcriptional regulator
MDEPAHQRTTRTRDKSLDREAATARLTDEMARFVRLLKACPPEVAGTDQVSLALLAPLLHTGPMRLRDLACAKGADPSTVSRQAAALVRAGLAVSDVDPRDGRARRHTLTEAGAELCQRLLADRRRVVEDAVGHWSDAQLATFAALFRDFNVGVEARIPSLPAAPLAPAAVPVQTTGHRWRTTTPQEIM